MGFVRKTSFNFDMYMSRQSQELALTLNTHILLSTRLAVCLPMFRSQAAIVSKTPLFSLFSIEKSKFRNLTLP